MLKPYMDSMSSAAPKTGEVVTDEDRIKSIKQHFDTLTALTPQDMTSENSIVTKNEEVESSDRLGFCVSNFLSILSVIPTVLEIF